MRSFRKSLGLTQMEFARELGLSRQQTISALEVGFHEPHSTTTKLLERLWQKHLGIQSAQNKEG